MPLNSSTSRPFSASEPVPARRFFHATAAVGNQYASVLRDLIAQFGNRAFTKQNAGWGMEIKVVHCSFPCVGEKRGQAMLPDDEHCGRQPLPLNAHFCRCLAHFYRLEKTDKSAHCQGRKTMMKWCPMNRDEICLLLTDKIKQLKNNENKFSDLLPDIRLLYGTEPGRARR
jgi:hypothetical protein